MQYELSILFTLKKSKIDKQGQVPIYLRITVDGSRVEISTNRKIEVAKWDNFSQRAKGRSEAAKTLNTYLDSLENQIKRGYNSLREREEEISASMLRDMVVGRYQKEYFLVQVFETNNKLIEKENGGKYSRSTINQYATTLNRLKLFIEKEYGNSDFALGKLDGQFIRRFDIFLRTEFGIDQNTIMKHLKQLKKVVHFAMELGYVDRDPFAGYKTAYKEVNRGYLTADELKRIEEHKFRIKRLERVRDVFVFVCYTGIPYSDLKNLTPDSVSKGIDGKNWIIYQRVKTGIRASIPLLPPAQAIVDKYKDDPECIVQNQLLPVKSNQKLNSYLSEIAELCGIDKHVTMHLGRHTFATTVTLTNGVPIESVQKMLGHKNLSTTQIYSKVVDTKISEDMGKVESKLQESMQKHAREENN